MNRGQNHGRGGQRGNSKPNGRGTSRGQHQGGQQNASRGQHHAGGQHNASRGQHQGGQHHASRGQHHASRGQHQGGQQNANRGQHQGGQQNTSRGQHHGQQNASRGQHQGGQQNTSRGQHHAGGQQNASRGQHNSGGQQNASRGQHHGNAGQQNGHKSHQSNTKPNHQSSTNRGPHHGTSSQHHPRDQKPNQTKTHTKSSNKPASSGNKFIKNRSGAQKQQKPFARRKKFFRKGNSQSSTSQAPLLFCFTRQQPVCPPFLPAHENSGTSVIELPSLPGRDPEDIVYSDDDTKSTISESSSRNIDISDEDSEPDFESDSEQSEESGISSVITSCSNENSSLGFGSSLDLTTAAKELSAIAVYWDIENCPVPSNKSAVDLVKKVRDQFHEGRIENCFVVACDARSLNENILRELEESNVTVVHSSSQNKNAADSKLQQFLLKFQYDFHNKNAAVVIISGDSDFASYLNDMHYSHHIHVVLICNNMARKSLRIAAQQCVSYEDFVKDLPDRVLKDSLEHYILVSNFPHDKKPSQVKSLLEQIIKNINGRLRNVTSSSVEMVFSNQATCNRAFERLQQSNVFGSTLKLQKKSRNLNSLKTEKKTSKTPKKGNDSSPSELIQKLDSIKLSKDNTAEKKTDSADVSKVDKNANVNAKEASLYVFVSSHVGDVAYWDKEFKVMFNTEELSTQWYKTSSECYFIVKFKSLSKAQKARKILEKGQKENEMAPKFLKLVKDEGLLHLTGSPDYGIVAVKKNAVEDHLKQISSRKLKALAEFAKEWDSMKCLHASASKKLDGVTKSELCSVYELNLREMNERKIAFLGFTETVCQKISQLNVCEPEFEKKIDLLVKNHSRECMSFQLAHPLYSKKPHIIKKLMKHQLLVVQAAAGSGKSSQICQYLWREGFSEDGLIVCSQPKTLSAMYLAKLVSHQMESRFGEIVGYDVGFSQKRSASTKILFTTDAYLVKMYLKDPTLKGISCLVIDEAHHRSYHTDLLMGFVRKCLVVKKDLKVVVTSAEEVQTSLFQQYFSLVKDAVIRVPCVPFPVEDIWLESDVALGWNYCGEAVATAFRVSKGEPGDILVYMATAEETHGASVAFNDMMKQQENNQMNVLVYCLHEYLDVQELQNVINEVPQGCRKVIFATNYANYFFLRGVKYVIDSGVVRYIQYDAEHNVSVLSFRFQEKTCAELRRKHACGTEGGKCYKLYSKANFIKLMAGRISAEIVKVDPAQAILKMAVGNGKVILDQVSLPEAVPQKSVASALKRLIKLNAITSSSMTLTDHGRNLAFLPLDVSLSDIVLRGIDLEIGYESIIAVCVASVARTASPWVLGTKKARFCRADSDFLAYLDVYKEWTDVPKNNKSQWCTMNGINSKCMQLSHELVMLTLKVLSEDLSVNVGGKFRKDNLLRDMLPKIVCQSLSGNVCIRSGLGKGYVSPSMPGSLLIHPCSALLGPGISEPQSVVYDIVLRSLKTFIVNVTSAPLNSCQSTLQRSSSTQLVDEKPLLFECLGTSVMKILVGKGFSRLRSLETEFQKITNNKECRIHADFAKGHLQVYVPGMLHGEVRKKILPMIISIQSQMLQKVLEMDIIPGFPYVRAVIGAGLQVNELILPGEYRSVAVTPVTCDADTVKDLLEQFGELVSTKVGKLFRQFTFRSTSDARNAVEQLRHETRFSVKPLLSKQRSETSEFRILLSFSRKLGVPKAFVSISPESMFAHAECVLMVQQIFYKNIELKVSTSEDRQKEICIEGLPEDTVESELASMVATYLPAGVSIDKLVIECQNNFPSVKQEVKIVKQQISDIFSQFLPHDRFEVELKKPKPMDRELLAVVVFKHTFEGLRVFNDFKSRREQGNYSDMSILSVKPSLETSLFCNRTVFNAICMRVSETLKFFIDGSQEVLKVRVTSKNENEVCISIYGENVDDVLEVTKAIQLLILGDQVNGHDYLCTKKGKHLIEELCNSAGNIHGFVKSSGKTVSLYGPESSCSEVKTKIKNHIDEFAAAKAAYLPLKLNDGSKSIVKELLKKYGYNLENLCSTPGLVSARINVCDRILEIRGNASSISQCTQKIQGMLAASVTDQSSSASGGEICPVCFEVVGPQSYLLEFCGHCYCEECVIAMFYNIAELPVMCCKKDCKKFLAVDDVTWAISKCAPLKKMLGNKLMELYSQWRSDIGFCPMSYCPMVYRMSDEKDCEYTCPACFNSICRNCGCLFHFGLSCDSYKRSKVPQAQNIDSGSLVQSFAETSKPCPLCKSSVYEGRKNTYKRCESCQTFMCWNCSSFFFDMDEASNHLQACNDG